MRRRQRCALSLVAALLAALGPPTAADDPEVTYSDTAGDAAARRTDPGADGPFDPEMHHLIDLLGLTIGAWCPVAPETDLFAGDFDEDGEFLRMDMLLAGLVNPPGLTDPDQYEPFEYGPHPVFGFVEVDMDEDEETGGELDFPEYRYLGNVVRFGGIPDLSYLEDRIALDASAFDGDFETSPYVERSGEEFHLALLGSVFVGSDVVEIVGDGDETFDAGEIWWIEAPWFHRAHGYEPFSFAEGGVVAGEYAPSCTVQFEHDVLMDVTRVSVVFPLTNVGAGLMWGEPPEPPNADPSDQFSVLEALIDLHDSAVFWDEDPSPYPEEEIIIEWEHKDPEDYLDPTEWRITALLGTSYTISDPTTEYFVWTDVYPEGLRGDVNGDGEADGEDRESIQGFVEEEDASDGTVDGRVELADFAVDFSVFDINHNGVVDELDELLVSVPGDVDHDADVDLLDFAALQACFSGNGQPFEPWLCGLVDIDADGDVDEGDVESFGAAMAGPAGE
jgi:hypothetical protein